MPIYDELGLPRDRGSTDKQDSARLAALLTVSGYDKSIPLSMYVKEKEYVRHPEEYIYNFSRDQAICLVAGLFLQLRPDLVNRKFVTGNDVFSPSQQGHFRICTGNKPTFLQKAWLWLDVTYSCFVDPLAEPNQLICIMLVAEPVYLRFWKRHNPQWKRAILDYWCEGPGSWRGEPELAHALIKTIEERQ